jgi:hypothetical protein
MKLYVFTLPTVAEKADWLKKTFKIEYREPLKPPF